MPKECYYVVDNIVGGVAILLRDDRQQVSIPISRLPSGVNKGTCLRVYLDEADTPVWPSVEIDESEAKRRLEK
ncbi:MAG: DUF3006 domain-containing protein [Gemmatimonadales bacterium]